MLYAVMGAEVEKVWQPGNLVAKSFFRNQALAAIFLDPSPALSQKQTIWSKHKRNYISIFRKWRNILSISSKYPKNTIKT